MKTEESTILLIDVNSVLYRAFHALPPLTGPSGEPTGALYGFFLALFKAIKDNNPSCIIAAFDHPAPTFRHKRFTAYKATRPPAPDDLVRQIKALATILHTFKIPCLEREGFEADDIIGTVAAHAAREGSPVVIVSGDTDILQLVDATTRVYFLRRGVKDTEIYDEEAVRAKYGVAPRLLNEVKALRGDASDNIPGVLGVGEKTALRMVRTFGSVQSICAAAREESHAMSKGVREKILAGEEQALLSRELVEITRDVPVDISLSSCSWGAYDEGAVREMFENLGFSTLADKIPGKTLTLL